MKHTIITKKEFIKGNKLRQLSDTQEQQSSQTYCYKPYRTLHNY